MAQTTRTQLLITRRQCNADVRKAVREDLEDPHGVDARTLIDHLLSHGPEPGTDTQLALKCALMSDAIRVVRATSDGPAREQPGIGRLAEMLELDDSKVEFLEDACVQDEKILSGELADAKITNAAKEMAARAGAVGVPLGAIYVCGSVTGLGAAGITSGLAALGLGGVLGLSAMVSGIGVVVIAGGITYKGVRWVLGGSQRNRASLREMMLQEVLRIHQGAIINLGEDMSHFGRRIAALSLKTDRNRDAIDELSREVMGKPWTTDGRLCSTVNRDSQRRPSAIQRSGLGSARSETRTENRLAGRHRRCNTSGSENT